MLVFGGPLLPQQFYSSSEQDEDTANKRVETRNEEKNEQVLLQHTLPTLCNITMPPSDQPASAPCPSNAHSWRERTRGNRPDSNNHGTKSSTCSPTAQHHHHQTLLPYLSQESRSNCHHRPPANQRSKNFYLLRMIDGFRILDGFPTVGHRYSGEIQALGFLVVVVDGARHAVVAELSKEVSAHAIDVAVGLHGLNVFRSNVLGLESHGGPGGGDVADGELQKKTKKKRRRCKHGCHEILVGENA